MPSLPAQADLFSSLSSIFVGDQAYALQANVSSISILEDKNNKDGAKDNIIGGINTNTDNISDDDKALTPNVGLMGVSDGKDTQDYSEEDISVYVVRNGDSISQIADMFEVSTNTILWANDMKKGDKLVEGDTLIILPVSGVKHTVLKGQTLKGIANKYKVDISDIASFNGIAMDSDLALGDELIIPDAEMVNVEAPKKPKTNSVNSIKTTLKTLVGYFINPVPGYKRVSQKLHGNNGVDLAAPIGTKIIAAASGTVLLARNGYNGGYGNMVIIKHSNGTKTLYAHQSKIATSTGAKVSQGEIIGYVGSTGRSTGPHLHYEIHGARNNTLDL
ncbi:MAG: peptidoglycan DD-metalloendopeptidase family protein [Candidatus Paceibacterota bacterium]